MIPDELMSAGIELWYSGDRDFANVMWDDSAQLIDDLKKVSGSECGLPKTRIVGAPWGTPSFNSGR